MSLFIPDDILKEAGITEQEARIELACRLYDTDRLSLWPAARLAGLGRAEFEAELVKRGMALVHYTEEDYRQDVEGIEHICRLRKTQSDGGGQPEAR